MFPYEGRLVNLRAKNCYDKIELQRFLRGAIKLGFEIIPLIQTFGHMEFVLKQKEFYHLREDPKYPDSICPTKIESQMLIKEMLIQMVNFHKNISPLKFIHIGCDEVFHINKCYECSRENFSNTDIFIKHIRKIKQIVEDINPETTVLIWDDMFRSIKLKSWNEIGYFNKIQTVYWDYGANSSVSHVNLLKYHRKFDNIWIATAFKGADGRLSTIPNLKNRFLNHLNWLKLIANYKFGGETNFHSFVGIILTGWSRYSHFDPLCELLPASIPSLLLNLLLIRKFNEGHLSYNNDIKEMEFRTFFNKYLQTDFSDSLHCVIHDIEKTNYSSCIFDGCELYNYLSEFLKIHENVIYYFESEKHGLSSLQYYANQKNLINTNNAVMNMKLCNGTLHELFDVERKLLVVMSQYYGNDTIEEYINAKMFHLKYKLEGSMKLLKDLMGVRAFETSLKHLKWDSTVLESH
ncbi:hexosaminidase D-like [Bombyx mandarina]|uniref:beta-N-acetylhexosaminidase n=1 Tax=Bombyx mandarina TaxID=7092 RepID=A0A6J2JQ61_BOMMA|nr:hexosaminidase D-like [Bombyx mandarina]